MTDDATRALIAEATEGHEPCKSRPGEAPICLACSPLKYPCDVVRLADALEAATAETGWEYGTAHVDDPTVGALDVNRQRAERRAAEWNRSTNSQDGFVVRRRAPGPWVPVEGDKP